MMPPSGLETTVKIAPGAHDTVIHAFRCMLVNYPCKIFSIFVQKENNQVEHVYSLTFLQNICMFFKETAFGVVLRYFIIIYTNSTLC